MLFLALVMRGCFFRPASHYSGSHFNRGKNAAWLGVTWTNDPHDADEISVLAADLTRYQIRYVFTYTSYLKDTGQFNPTYDHAESFIATLRAANPEIKVLAWLGIPLDYVDLGDSAVRQKIVEFTSGLIPLGFDGIHLDPEPVVDGDANVLALLEETQQRIGDDSILSIASRHISPLYAEVSLPGINHYWWSAGYYRQVAEHVDQIALMTYDSALPHALLYRQFARFEAIEITQALQEADVEVLLGVPTSEEETASHRPYAENMESGLQGIIDGLNDHDSYPSVITGVAIYPYWETDPTEWASYERLWLGDR